MSYEEKLKLKAFERKMLKIAARKGSLLAFTKYTFPKYEIGWHHKLTADYIDKLITGEIRRLIITEPPRHGKTELTSRRLPPFIHGLFPDDEILAASYNSDFASDATIDVQRIMDSKEFKEIFRDSRITPEGTLGQYARNRNEHELLPYKNFRGEVVVPSGSYNSAGVGGSFTGKGGKWIIIDDPIKNREDADSKAFRDKLWSFYTSTIRSRLEKDARILITLTRWHKDDLAGRLLKLAQSDPAADQWVVLSLPAIRDMEDNDYDPRPIGEALWPSKFSVPDLMATKASSGSRDWNSLYQQRPVAEGGNIIRSEWIKYYTMLPPRFDTMIQSWDFATKDKQSSDFAVGQVWGRIGANFFLVAQVRGRWPFPTACKQLVSLSNNYRQAYKKAVEAKANGPAVVQTLKNTVPGIMEVEPQGDKVARMNAVAPLYEAGQVWYPDPQIAPWIVEHVSEITNFPLDINDDQADAASQGLNILRNAAPVTMPLSGHGSGVIN